MKNRKIIFGALLILVIGTGLYMTACKKFTFEPQTDPVTNTVKQSYFTAKVNGIECEWNIIYPTTYTNTGMYFYVPNGHQDVTVTGEFGNLIIHTSNGVQEPYTYIQDTNYYTSNIELFHLTFSPSMEVDPDPYCDFGQFGNNVAGYKSSNLINYLNHYHHYPPVSVIPTFHIEVNNEEVIEGSFDASLLNSCYADSTDLGIITITEAKFKFYRKEFKAE